MTRLPISQTALENERFSYFEKPEEEWKKILTPDQYRVLRQGGTDQFEKSEYYQHFEKNGVYCCAACGSPLYLSEHKMMISCGWNSFFTNLPKHIREHPEPKNPATTALSCNFCQSHIGHIYRRKVDPSSLMLLAKKNVSEAEAKSNERHCVNGTSIRFVENAEEVLKRFQEKIQQFQN